MSRSAAFLVAMAVALAAVRGAPKAKEAPKPATFQPVAVGTKWVYDDNGREWAEQIIGTESKDGETVLTVQFGGAAGAEAMRTVVVSAGGVFIRGTAKFIFDPVCMLKLPVTAGRSWDVRQAPQEGLMSYEGTMTAGAAEKVEVPAGTFEAVPVRLEVTAKDGRKLDQPAVYTWWWAPDVGVVRLKSDTTDRKLKSFTPGKVVTPGKSD